MNATASATIPSVPPNAAPPPPRIRRSVGEDGVYTLTFHTADGAINAFDETAFRELQQHLDALAEMPHRVEALVVASAKADVFHLGLSTPQAPLAAEDLEAYLRLVELGQAVFDQLKNLPFPTVAAINGACHGAGLEMALACDWRVATSTATLGFPEIHFGLLPAMGGCERLVELLGLRQALDLVANDRSWTTGECMRLGLIDEVATQDSLIEVAEWAATQDKRSRKVWHSAKRFATALLARHRLARRLRQRDKRHRAGLVQTWNLMCTPASSAELHLLALTALSRQLTLPETLECIHYHHVKERALHPDEAAQITATKVRNVMIFGAGDLGIDFAHRCIQSGIHVTVSDHRQAALGQTLKEIDARIEADTQRASITAVEGDAMRRLFTSRPSEEHQADLIIDATSDPTEFTRNVDRHLGSLRKPDTLLAITTPTLSLTDAASRLTNPENLLGLRVWGLANETPLVEVIVGAVTRPAAVQRVMAFVRQLGSIPIAVADTPGNLVLRLLTPYLASASVFYSRHSDPRQIDRAMLDFGMALGPLRFMDEVGIDTVVTTMRALANALPGHGDVPSILEAMVEKGLTGRHSGKGGFYHYHGDHAEPNKHTLDLRPKNQPAPGNRGEIQRSLALSLTGEANHCLEHGVANDKDQLDLALVFGAGWPQFRGYSQQKA